MRIVLQMGGLSATCLVLCLALDPVQAASATQKECSARYQAAKAGNTLNGLTYNQFRKQCSAELKAEKAGGGGATPSITATPTTTAPTSTVPTTTAPASTAPVAPPTTSARAQSAPKQAAPAAVGNAVYPSAIAAQFSKEPAGKARMHTCLAQYNANKANNGNGGLRWIQTGGGYYSECNKRLKS